MSLDLLADMLIGFGVLCLLGCIGAYIKFMPGPVHTRRTLDPNLPISATELALRQLSMERKERRL